MIYLYPQPYISSESPNPLRDQLCRAVPKLADIVKNAWVTFPYIITSDSLLFISDL